MLPAVAATTVQPSDAARLLEGGSSTVRVCGHQRVPGELGRRIVTSTRVRVPKALASDRLSVIPAPPRIPAAPRDCSAHAGLDTRSPSVAHGEALQYEIAIPDGELSPRAAPLSGGQGIEGFEPAGRPWWHHTWTGGRARCRSAHSARSCRSGPPGRGGHGPGVDAAVSVEDGQRHFSWPLATHRQPAPHEEPSGRRFRRRGSGPPACRDVHPCNLRAGTVAQLHW